MTLGTQNKRMLQRRMKEPAASPTLDYVTAPNLNGMPSFFLSEANNLTLEFGCSLTPVLLFGGRSVMPFFVSDLLF